MNLLFKEILVVMVGGGLGSTVRLLLSRWVTTVMPYENLPWGIIVVNILGCFCIGVLYVLFSSYFLENTLWRVGLIVGVLGGFTTFSSFSLDTIHLVEKGMPALAVFNVLISLICCLSATSFGVWLARWIVA